MTQLTNDFLYRLYELLQADHWGTIEPEWFDPDFLPLDDEENPSEEQEWAQALQELVEKALESS